MLTAFLWMSLQTAGEQGSSESKQNRGLWEKESCTDNKNMRLAWWCVNKLSNNQRINPKVKQSNNPRYLINRFYGHFSQTRCSFKTINHTLVKMTERRGSHFVYLYFWLFLPHDPGGPVTPALILKANWPLAVGTWYNFLFFQEGQTRATPSLLIAYEAIKSHWGAIILREAGRYMSTDVSAAAIRRRS